MLTKKYCTFGGQSLCEFYNSPLHVFLKKPRTLLLPRTLWHFLLRFLFFSFFFQVVFILLITFRLCSDVEKRANIQEGAVKGQRESLPFLHNMKFVDPPRVFAAAALAGKNTTRGTGGGGDHDEKQSSGRMFFPRPIGKQSRCFRLSSDVLGNVFFRNLEESLLWHGNFIFVLPPMWLQQNVSDAVVHHQTLVLSHLVNINGPSLSTTSPVWRLFSIILSLLQPFRRLKNKLAANVHHLTSVGMMANVVAVVL